MKCDQISCHTFKVNRLSIFNQATAYILMHSIRERALTLKQFSEARKSWNEAHKNIRKECWERARMVAAIVVEPYFKKTLRPTDRLHFSWAQIQEKPLRMSKEEQLKRMEVLKKEWEKEIEEK